MTSDSGKQKIVVLSNSGGGLIDFRGEVIAALCKLYNVTICIPKRYAVENTIEAFRTMGASVNPFEMERRSMNPFKDLKVLKYYKKLLKQVNPDLVLTYTIKPNIYGGWACQSQHVPYIANITGLGTTIQNGGLFSKLTTSLYKKGLKKASCVFFQNTTNRDILMKKGVVSGKTRVIPGSGVNLDKHPYEEYPVQSFPVRFLFMGRIMKDKGIEELLYAVRKLKDQGYNVSIDIIGNYVEDYKQKILEAEKEGLVHYYGFQTDVNAFIRKAHCIVLPSYHEGMSNVLLEAASSGRPVITTTVPGCKETFEEGITGFGCSPKDGNSLAEAMENFIALSNNQRAEMGRKGRVKIEKEFDRNLVVKAYLEEVNVAIHNTINS